MSRNNTNDSYHCWTIELALSFSIFFWQICLVTFLFVWADKTGTEMNFDLRFPYTSEKIFILTYQNEHDDGNSSKVQDYSPGKVP